MDDTLGKIVNVLLDLLTPRRLAIIFLALWIFSDLISFKEMEGFKNPLALLILVIPLKLTLLTWLLFLHGQPVEVGRIEELLVQILQAVIKR
jgi:hypothetical protein